MTHDLEKARLVFVVGICSNASDTARHDVIDGAVKFDSKGSAHLVSEHWNGGDVKEN